MSNAPSSRIHPTAVISREAELADDVVVGPYTIIEGPVRVGPGCVLRAHVHLCGPLTLGRRNQVFTGCVLGEQPQHVLYNGEPTGLEIGDDNIFREHVTVHRGTSHSWLTRIGSHNYFMAHCHIAHDCRVGNRCILANGALVGGHCTLEDGVFLSGNAGVHQFIHIGRLALVSATSATSKDVPPFVIVQNINWISGVNVVGMRRAGMTSEQINAVRRAFRIIYHAGLSFPNSLARVERELGGVDAVMEMVTFIRQSKRGVSSKCDRRRGEAA